MDRSVEFYEALGLELSKGGRQAEFSTFHVGHGAFNLIAVQQSEPWPWWGRIIFQVDDVDAMYRHVVAVGLKPDFAPSNAPWGERYFHITDPDGHEVSFQTPLDERSKRTRGIGT